MSHNRKAPPGAVTQGKVLPPRPARLSRPVVEQPAAPALLDREAGYPDDWRRDLANLERRRLDLGKRELEIVDQALRAGATWSAIGSVLGVTRQSAHQRFAGKVERRRSREQ